jgi:hypothetical protein
MAAGASVCAFSYRGIVGSLPARRSPTINTRSLFVASGKYLLHPVAGSIQIHVRPCEEPPSHPFSFTQEAEDQMFGTDMGVVETLGLFPGKLEYLLEARSDGHFSLLVFASRTTTDCVLHGLAHDMEITSKLTEEFRAHTVSFLENAKQEVFRSDIRVVEAPRLFLSQCQNGLSPLCEPLEGVWKRAAWDDFPGLTCQFPQGTVCLCFGRKSMTFQIVLDIGSCQAEFTPHPIGRQLAFAYHAPHGDDVDAKELSDIFCGKQGFHHDLQPALTRTNYTVL